MTDGANDRPGVIAPPPLIYLGFLLAGLGLDRVWPIATLDDGLRYPGGVGLIALGLVVAFLGFAEFRKAGTAVNPHRSTTAIITTGPFRFSRNPLYLALALIHAGVAMAAQSFWALVFLAPALVVVRYGVIAREERYLERKFGRTYLDYKTTVRRWL
ncbi:MAG: methyltransferase family protein [Alphaproteobacteria bacterium]